MSTSTRDSAHPAERLAGPRRYLMCAPEHFTVSYEINPWMDAAAPVDASRALEQWQELRATFERLGHQVHVVPAAPGLPDMVYAANGALVTPQGSVGVRFAHPERAGEAEAYARWLEEHGLGPVHRPVHVNEGEGDLLVVGEHLLAGHGFRTDLAAHREVEEVLGRPVTSLRLVDPRFYHLDTALTVLDDDPEHPDVAYFPGAFDEESQRVLAGLFPHALRTDAATAQVLGMNAVSDGKHVVLSPRAQRYAEQLAQRGYVPVPVDLSELLRGGGGAKCCTLVLRG
ncbi:dimethylargininase [Kineococcus sp. SYSU DK018]|uniref:dimethylargininase n=1 Tax=Kineococcus sp. SYSU DK018 TaxID=3383139 RepID=UPI003D7E3668